MEHFVINCKHIFHIPQKGEKYYKNDVIMLIMIYLVSYSYFFIHCLSRIYHGRVHFLLLLLCCSVSVLSASRVRANSLKLQTFIQKLHRRLHREKPIIAAFYMFSFHMHDKSYGEVLFTIAIAKVLTFAFIRKYRRRFMTNHTFSSYIFEKICKKC